MKAIKTGKSYDQLHTELMGLAETLNNVFPKVKYIVRTFGANGLQLVGESSEPGIENIYSNILCCDQTKVDLA